MIALKTPFEFLRYFETHPTPISSSSADVRWKHVFAIFFSKYSCVYILCLWACPNLYAFYTSDFFAFH